MGKFPIINAGFSIVKLCPGKSNGAMAKMHPSYTLTYNLPIQQIAHVQPCQQVSQSPPTRIAQVASAGSSQPTLGSQECATLGASQYMARRGRAARAGNSCWLVCQRAKPPATWCGEHRVKPRERTTLMDHVCFIWWFLMYVFNLIYLLIFIGMSWTKKGDRHRFLMLPVCL